MLLGMAFQNSLLFQNYSGIAQLNPEYRILFWLFPTKHCTWEFLKKHQSLKNQGGPHSAVSLIRHGKSTIYHCITHILHFHNIQQRIS